MKDVSTCRWLMMLDLVLMTGSLAAQLAGQPWWWVAILIAVATAIFGWLLVAYDFSEGAADRISRDPDHVSTLSTFLDYDDEYSVS